MPKPPAPPEPRRPARGPVSVRELIAAGPTFGDEGMDHDTIGCALCGLVTKPLDARTGLGRCCYAAWRFSCCRPNALDAEPGWTPPEGEPASTVPSGTSTGVSG